jgi:dephospho-CoA kinase
MTLIGLTGGVGMGKSTAAKFFGERGVRVVDTDHLARELVQPGLPALEEIRSVFGDKMISADGQLRREKLAGIVFSDAVARKKLEDILHPRIRERWMARVESWRKENCPLAIVVIPLLFETFAESYFDKIVCVACSDKSRFERLRDRGWTAEQIHARIDSQMPVVEKMGRAHFVVWSEGVIGNHELQVDRILGCITAAAK